MTIREYVDEVLCVPITRIGCKYIVEAIEIVIDTKEHKFYQQLATILKVPARYLEKAMRDAKTIGLNSMESSVKTEIFGEGCPTTTEYVLKGAEYYRRCYYVKD